MPGQLSNAIKEARSRAAIAVAEEMKQNYLRALIDTTQEVLFEEESGGLFIGHAPNYVKIYAPGISLHNEIRPVRITGIHADGVIGELV